MVSIEFFSHAATNSELKNNFYKEHIQLMNGIDDNVWQLPIWWEF